MEFTIKFAEEQDTAIILNFIKELAKYEKLLSEVSASKEILREQIFEKKYAEVLLARLDGKVIGFALFFHNFSTFMGKSGIYLEDLFVLEAFRGKGYGKKILQFLAKLALERNCGRLEWSVLDWNQEAIDFYESLGARMMNEWKVFRLTGVELKQLGNN
ncbi:MAG: GNAT family N-acetyltransferase [Bacteroidota bacterium]|nr:GNAT family N-acetyltransferase [Bacteroidota bacterium]